MLLIPPLQVISLIQSEVAVSQDICCLIVLLWSVSEGIQVFLAE